MIVHACVERKLSIVSKPTVTHQASGFLLESKHDRDGSSGLGEQIGEPTPQETPEVDLAGAPPANISDEDSVCYWSEECGAGCCCAQGSIQVEAVGGPSGAASSAWFPGDTHGRARPPTLG